MVCLGDGYAKNEPFVICRKICDLILCLKESGEAQSEEMGLIW